MCMRVERARSFLTILFLVLSALFMFLWWIEWRELKDQVYKLRLLKREYRRYLDLLSEDCVESEDDSDGDNSFTLLNREWDYLRDSALAFAKPHNLDEAVQELYALDGIFEKSVYPEVHVPIAPRLPMVSVEKKSKNVAVSRINERKVISVNFAVQWPLEKSDFWISSRFGPRRKKDRSWGFHYGIDLAALKGTPVYAAADGVIVQARHARVGYGNCIVIAHDKKYKTRYAHLDRLCVSPGQRVTAGKLIGRVGDTGLVRGKNASHLHFEVIAFGKRINPLYILS